MIQNILNTLPLLSDYYDATKGVIEKPEKDNNTNIQSTITETEEQSTTTNNWV